MADYRRLIRTLSLAFRNTAQPGEGLPIYYNEYGIQSIIPPEKEHLYFGEEQPTTYPVNETAQARNLQEALQIMSCQPNVIGFTFFLNKDEKNKRRWQSGLRYANGDAKSSLRRIMLYIRQARDGTIDCK
jgi:hypothetical protein